jgi:hypothetical protein
MNIMKVAIAGKDDEQFPGEAEQSTLEPAKAAQPAIPNPTQSPAAHPSPAYSPRLPSPPRAQKITAPQVAKPVQAGLARPLPQH